MNLCNCTSLVTKSKKERRKKKKKRKVGGCVWEGKIEREKRWGGGRMVKWGSGEDGGKRKSGENERKWFPQGLRQ